MKNKYTLTYIACFMGIFSQALVINFAPLLFVEFEKSYNITLEKISFLITLTFTVQLLTDLLAVKLIAKKGYRFSACLSQLLSAAGLVFLGVLPDFLSNPYSGLLISVFVYSIGAGLVEVIASPVVEACPGKRKSAVMSLLHSFYCWGQVIVILISTFAFYFFGTKCRNALSFLWSVVPFVNFFLFLRAPMPDEGKEEEKVSYSKLFKNKLFIMFLLIMLCGGATELGISQWASAFAEKGLNVSKTTGDILGPCLFALFMGTTRVFYGVYRGKVSLSVFMLAGGILAFTGYLFIALPLGTAFGFIGCALTGLAVGIMWPGTLSLASKAIPGGGTAMYSLLAFAGDIGCTLGPSVIGFAADMFGGNLSSGILVASAFPLVLIICMIKRIGENK